MAVQQYPFSRCGEDQASAAQAATAIPGHHGVFTVATAPAAGVTAGDMGWVTNGIAGSAGPCWYSGSAWVTVAGAAIATS